MRGVRCLVLVVFVAAATAASAEPLSVGDRAPNFQLPATIGGSIRLSDYLGESLVLLEFYHSDWGPRCTAKPGPATR